MSKTYNFDIFQTVSQICTSSPPKFCGGSKISSRLPICILSKLHYAKFGVSNLLFSKVIEEKPLGGSARLPPLPLDTGRVNVSPSQCCNHCPFKAFLVIILRVNYCLLSSQPIW